MSVIPPGMMAPIAEAEVSEEAAAVARVGVAMGEALARAARQVGLYGPDHSVAAGALREAWRGLAEVTVDAPAELRVEEAGFRWNRVPVAAANDSLRRFHQSLRDRLVATVRFSRQLEATDLARLLVLLAQDAQLLVSGGGLLQALGVGGTEGLVVEDVDFGQDLETCARTWIGLCPELESTAADPLRGLLGSCLHLVRAVGDQKTLEEIRQAMAELAPADPEDPASATEAVAGSIAALLQAAGEIALHTSSGTVERWQTAVLEHLASLGPRWNAFIFRAPVQASQDNPDVLALLTRQMPFGRRVSLVLDYPDCIVSERSEGLRLVLGRLFREVEEAPALERALHDRARAQGIPEQLYRNVVGVLLREVTEERPSGGAPRLAAEGLALEAEEEWTPLLSSLEPARMRRSWAGMLSDLLEADLAGAHYRAAVGRLLDLLQEAAQEGDTDLLVSLLERLLEEVSRMEGPGTARRAVAEGALRGRAEAETVALLARELDRLNPHQQSGLLRLVGQLGDTGQEALLARARGTRARDAGEALRALAETDTPPYAHLLQYLGDLPIVDLEESLRMLLLYLDPALADRVGVVASHPDFRARLALIHAVSELRSRVDVEMIAPLLADQVPDVRAAAAAALGAGRGPATVPGLCHLLDREPGSGPGARVREAAARALGEIGAPEAVPALTRILWGRGLLARFARPEPRLAAADALRRIGTPEAKEALTQGLRTSPRSVREACRRALGELAALADPATGGSDVG